MNSQGKFLLGLAAGGVAVGGGFLAYNKLGISADSAKGDTKVLTGYTIDARNVTCDASKGLISDGKVVKGDDGKMYKGDAKVTLVPTDVKDDSLYIKTDGKVYKTDGVKYDAKPALTDGKVYKTDGKYVKSDGKPVAIVPTTSTGLIKTDGKIMTKTDTSLTAYGPVFIFQGQQIVCTVDGRALPITADAKSIQVLNLTPEV